MVSHIEILGGLNFLVLVSQILVYIFLLKLKYLISFEPTTSCPIYIVWAVSITTLLFNWIRSTELIDSKYGWQKRIFLEMIDLIRIYLWNQASRWIDNILSTISIVTIVNEFTSFAKGTKTKGFIGNEFIGRKTVVKFNNINITRFETG